MKKQLYTVVLYWKKLSENKLKRKYQKKKQALYKILTQKKKQALAKYLKFIQY